MKKTLDSSFLLDDGVSRRKKNSGYGLKFRPKKLVYGDLKKSDGNISKDESTGKDKESSDDGGSSETDEKSSGTEGDDDESSDTEGENKGNE